MLEREVSSAFNTMFAEYGLLAPINSAQAGWPDRLVQLANSVVVAVEIKLFQQLNNGSIRLAEFRPTQAAWLAKWQRNGGKCFLFMGILSYTSEFVGYAILTVNHWKTWTTLPNCRMQLEEFDFVSNEDRVILDWFRVYTESAYA